MMTFSLRALRASTSSAQAFAVNQSPIRIETALLLQKKPQQRLGDALGGRIEVGVAGVNLQDFQCGEQVGLRQRRFLPAEL